MEFSVVKLSKILDEGFQIILNNSQLYGYTFLYLLIMITAREYYDQEVIRCQSVLMCQKC